MINETIKLSNLKKKLFFSDTDKIKFFHLHKTGGTFISELLPGISNIGHYPNFFQYMKDKQHSKIIPFGSIRNPIDFYPSSINFWLSTNQDIKYLAKQQNVSFENVSFNKLDKLDKLDLTKSNHIANFLNADAKDDLNKALSLLFQNEFLTKYEEYYQHSLKDRSYKIFKIMKRHDIGFFTFSFLEQYCNFDLSQSLNIEEVVEDTFNNFEFIDINNYQNDLIKLQKKYNFKPLLENSNISNTKKSDPKTKPSLPIELEIKIKHLDRFIYKYYDFTK
jgi:hypothetical protein